MKFVAFERSKQGTGASRRLRDSGKTPGIVYGGSGEPVLIELDHNALWYALKKDIFHASILQMELAGKTSQVTLRDVQYHPFRPLVLHVDFQRVNSNAPMNFKVALHYINGENSPAVKEEGCVINTVITELDIHCLPGDLPEHIEVDLAELHTGTLHLADIKLPKGVEVRIHGEDQNPVLVSASQPAEDKAEAEEAAAAETESAAAAAADEKKS